MAQQTFSDMEYSNRKRKTNRDKFLDIMEEIIDHRKSSVRCKVEHAFHIIKNRFGFTKVRYRGIAKNLNKLNMLFACANLLMYAEAKQRSVVSMG